MTQQRDPYLYREFEHGTQVEDAQSSGIGGLGRLEAQ
jgi:hypothetical protein